MPTTGYLTNQFPSPLESYVVDEILELRRRGITVIPCSAWRVQQTTDAAVERWRHQTLYLQPLRWRLLLRALWTCISRRSALRDLWRRIVSTGTESVSQRLRAVLHTWLGAYYALLLTPYRVEHIHVHHGYFSAWIAMVAARLLGIGYSLTLHGSDLLLHKAFLDSKLANCKACLTVSEYNLNYIRDTYPEIDQRKLVLRRLGVESPPADCKRSQSYDSNLAFVLLAAGRLHPVKDHAFLLRGCAVLRAHGTNIICLIAGDGPEKARLVRLVKKLGLQGTTIFLGYLSRVELASLYAKVDLLVVTSRSEGIPVVLMEAMACGVPVLAPRITGIPELVVDGQTGFLYQPGSVSDFAGRVELIRKTAHSLGPLRRAAREHVLTKFNHQANLQLFADTLLQCISPALYEDSLSQQI